MFPLENNDNDSPHLRGFSYVPGSLKHFISINSFFLHLDPMMWVQCVIPILEIMCRTKSHSWWRAELEFGPRQFGWGISSQGEDSNSWSYLDKRNTSVGKETMFGFRLWDPRDDISRLIIISAFRSSSKHMCFFHVFICDSGTYINRLCKMLYLLLGRQRDL